MKKILLVILSALGSFVYSQTTFIQNSISYPTCFGVCDGIVVFSTTTTPGPFTAVLSNTASCSNTITQSSTGNTITIGGLCTCTDTYQVLFFNSSMVLVGSELLQIPITATSALVLQTPTVNVASCSSCCDGSVFVSYSGGYAPAPNNASVALDGNNVGANYFPIPTVCPGPHTVCVTDLANCTACNSFTVGFTLNVGTNASTDVKFAVSPNPANDKIIISSLGGELPREIRFMDMSGKMILEQNIKSNSGRAQEIQINTIPGGVYIIEMMGAFGIARQKLIKLE